VKQERAKGRLLLTPRARNSFQLSGGSSLLEVCVLLFTLEDGVF